MANNDLAEFLPICINPRIVIFPQGERGRRCTKKLLEINCQLVGIVLSNPLLGEDEKLYSLIKVNKYNLLNKKSLSERLFIEFLIQAKPDIIILAGFGLILPMSIISIAKTATINLHAGKLPEYRGTSIIQWQILKGENQVGCTIHIVDKGIDTGPILTQFLYPININDTSAKIMLHNQDIFPRLLEETIEKIAHGTAKLIYQNEAKAAYHCKLFQEDAAIKWHQMNALEVHNLIRAFNFQNQKGAYTYYKKKKIIIQESSLLEKTIIGISGRVLLKHRMGVLVMCKDKAILVCKSDFALKPGQILG